MKWKKRLKELEALRAKYGKGSYRHPFPDLSVEQRTSPTSDMSGARGGSIAKRPAMPQQHGLLVGTPHKQGPMVLAREDLPWAGGKKP